MNIIRSKHPAVRFFGWLVLGFALADFAVHSQGACRTNVAIGDAIQLGDGPLAAPNARFPFIAYSLNVEYSTFYNQTISDVKTDECVREPFSKQAFGKYESALSLVSVSSGGEKPDFRFRAKGALGQKLALERVAGVGAGGTFRFRDLFTFKNPGTNPVNVAVTISMDGNVSRPMSAIPVPEQQGNALVRLLVEDLTFCRPGHLLSVTHQAQTQGPDYFQTYVLTVCPTAIIRVDVRVDLNATASRFGTVGQQSYYGGYTYADYTQCITGNSVCFEDCVDPDLDNCSGFSIRVQLVPPPAGPPTGGQMSAVAAPPVELVSAAGYDYSVPLPVYRPSLRIRQVQGNSLVEWPSGASGWNVTASSNLVQWNIITNQSAFDPEDGMFQMIWPLATVRQFFRLEKP